VRQRLRDAPLLTFCKSYSWSVPAQVLTSLQVLALEKAYPDFPVTVYLRNKALDSYLTETAGVKRIVHGTFDEKEKIVALAKEHDVVINVGSSWDVGLVSLPTLLVAQGGPLS
jgi:hypothetical protein